LALLLFLEQHLSPRPADLSRGGLKYCSAVPADPLRKMILIEPPRSTAAARREPLNRRDLARFTGLAIKAAGCSGTVSVLLTSDERIQQLNREFRGKNAPTDVLSFPAVSWDFGAARGHRSKSAGDLAISLDTAARQADNMSHSLATEVKVLILHGALHLAGFDHETDTGEMARKEIRLRRELGLASGLIERSIADARPAGLPKKTIATGKSSSGNRRQRSRGRG
jgi:probable rRNA maturation factor